MNSHLLSLLSHRNEPAFSKLLHSGEHLGLGDSGGKPRQEQGRVGWDEAQETRLDQGETVLYTDIQTKGKTQKGTQCTSGQEQRERSTTHFENCTP